MLSFTRYTAVWLVYTKKQKEVSQLDRDNAKVVELDVRPYLRQKLEPFQIIMDTVKGLDNDDIFVLHATFKPTPLFGVLKMKGLVGKAEQIDKDHWKITFVHKKNKDWLELPDSEIDQSVKPLESPIHATQKIEAKIIQLDNRGLEPPQPMVRTLAALEKSNPGDEVMIHNDRVPVFLIEELTSLGYPFTIEDQEDGSAKVKITKV